MARRLWDSTLATVWGNLRSVNNLSGLEGRLVRWSAGVVPASSTTSAVLGVLVNGGEASAVPVAIAVGGITQAIIGDDVSPGDLLVPDASSRGTLTALASGYRQSVQVLMSAESGDAAYVRVGATWRY